MFQQLTKPVIWCTLRSYCMQHHLGTLATKAIHVLKYLSCSSEINSCSLSLLCCTYNLISCSACFYMLWSSSKASRRIGEERKIIPIDSICAQSTLRSLRWYQVFGLHYFSLFNCLAICTELFLFLWTVTPLSIEWR